MKEKAQQIQIDGIEITVTKKHIRHMYLRIRREDGSVRISAPYQMSDVKIWTFAAERMDWIRECRKKYEKVKDDSKQREELGKEELQKEKKLLKERVEVLVEKWKPVIGVEVSGITIRQMKTRWGSCNVRTHHININLALSQKPMECLEYVVVHEMTHILEASHNQVFWSHMTTFYPEWRSVRKILNG